MLATHDDLRDRVARIRGQYDAFYGSADIAHYSPRLTRRLLQVLFDHAKVPRTSRILDLGCGAGYYSAILRGLGFPVVGIDISETAIAKARGAHPGIEFHVADALNLDDALKPFDAIFMMGCSLLNTPSLETIQSVVLRVAAQLNPGGVLLLVFGSDLTGHASAKSDWINHGPENLRRFATRSDLAVEGPYLSHVRLIHLLRGAALNPIVSRLLLNPRGLFRRLVVIYVRPR